MSPEIIFTTGSLHYTIESGKDHWQLYKINSKDDSVPEDELDRLQTEFQDILYN